MAIDRDSLARPASRTRSAAILRMVHLPMALRADAGHRPRITSIPDNTSSNCRLGIFPARSTSWRLSKATISDTFATESFGKLVAAADKRTFPGARSHLRLLVSGTQTTVPIRLVLSASHCTTTTGRRKPGAEPTGSPRSAHQVSPCPITTLSLLRPFARLQR